MYQSPWHESSEEQFRAKLFRMAAHIDNDRTSPKFPHCPQSNDHVLPVHPQRACVSKLVCEFGACIQLVFRWRIQSWGVDVISERFWRSSHLISSKSSFSESRIRWQDDFLNSLADARALFTAKMTAVFLFRWRDIFPIRKKMLRALSSLQIIAPRSILRL